MKSILDYETVDYDRERHALVIIDQTKLPNDITLLSLTTAQEIWDAIYQLKVRGAPAIGVAAAFGLAALAQQISSQEKEIFLRELKEKKEFLNSARPTAVNLSWALDRMMSVCKKKKEASVTLLKNKLVEEAFLMKKEDIDVCRKIGEYGLRVLDRKSVM